MGQLTAPGTLPSPDNYSAEPGSPGTPEAGSPASCTTVGSCNPTQNMICRALCASVSAAKDTVGELGQIEALRSF